MNKKKVIVIIDKSCKNELDSLQEIIKKWFPEKYYDIDIYSRDSFRNMNVNFIWMEERLPIVIGYGYGAVYLEQVKNYSIKFLISPFWNENLLGSIFYNIDDYDRQNTYCLFGDNPKSLEMATLYSKHYPKTLSNLCEGKLNIIDGIEICGILNLFSFEGKKFEQ